LQIFDCIEGIISYWKLLLTLLINDGKKLAQAVDNFDVFDDSETIRKIIKNSSASNFCNNVSYGTKH